ncbi:hypothetical protein [Paenibacillus sp. JGP012]|uniref:hypothetical protein n=1 Tax=Paenibacillus sp. JGP012 TaxID=2735914 RepID=UPI00161CB33D|nr:hypothetical protein [Paenibacillus sp. JGP012]
MQSGISGIVGIQLSPQGTRRTIEARELLATALLRVITASAGDEQNRLEAG